MTKINLNPPLDPEERRIWKPYLHAVGYGMSREQIDRLMASALREQLEYRRRKRDRIKIFITGICVGTAIVLLYLYFTTPH